jgi:predicted dienelactone hydrolase
VRFGFLRLLLLGILILAPGSLFFLRHVYGQEAISAPRSDGQSTPLMIYKAESVSGGVCAPLAVISHGAGGSEKGYGYIAEAMAKNGYTTVVMGHKESGFSALRQDVEDDGLRPGVQALVVNTQAEQARLLDVGAALKWADGQCKAPFRVLLGHSMGAITVMLEAGAKNIIDVASPPAGQDRFDAYVALSPEGPGVVFAEQAWGGIHKPILILTGTRDESLKGGPEARQIPWQELPGDAKGKCQWMGVIDGATHMNFAGRGLGHRLVEPKVTETITSFLSGARTDSCAVPAPVRGMKLQAK